MHTRALVPLTGRDQRQPRVDQVKGAQPGLLLEVEDEPGLHLPGFHLVDRGVDVLELAPLVDDLSLPCGVQLEDLLQVHPGADDRTEYLRPVQHGLEDGKLDVVVSGEPDEYQGAAPPKGAVRLLERLGCADPPAVRAELIQLVRDQIGPVAALRRVDVVAALPKTCSGKILRKTMRGIADGNDEPVPSTIEDPAALDALRPLLHGG